MSAAAAAQQVANHSGLSEESVENDDSRDFAEADEDALIDSNTGGQNSLRHLNDAHTKLTTPSTTQPYRLTFGRYEARTLDQAPPAHIRMIIFNGYTKRDDNLKRALEERESGKLKVSTSTQTPSSSPSLKRKASSDLKDPTSPSTKKGGSLPTPVASPESKRGSPSLPKESLIPMPVASASPESKRRRFLLPNESSTPTPAATLERRRERPALPAWPKSTSSPH